MRDNNKNYYDESYKEYFKQRQFGILKKARDLNIYIHNLANKMPKKCRQEGDKLKNLADDILEYIEDANSIIIDEKITKEQYLLRCKSQNAALERLKYLDDYLICNYENKNITEKQFENSTRKNHYIRLSILNWIDSDSKRYKVYSH